LIRSSLKKFRSLFRFLLVAVFALYLLLLVAVKFGPAQRALTHVAAEMLSEKVGSRVTIDKLELGLFNRVIFYGVRIDDQKSKPLLSAGRLTAKLELRSLFQSRIVLRSVSLLDADVLLYKEKPNDPLNAQFLIDAFASKKEGESKLNLRVGSLILRRVNVKYDELYRPVTPHRFNLSHLSVRDVDANVSLRCLTPDSVALRVRSLSFHEQSGVALRQMHFKLQASRTRAEVEDFSLQTPNSQLTLSHFATTYDARKSWSNLSASLYGEARLSDAIVNLSDLRPFLTLPAEANGVLRWRAYLAVSPNLLEIKKLSVQEQNHTFSLTSNLAFCRDASGVRSVEVRLLHVNAQPSFTSQVLKCFSADTTLVQAATRAGELTLNGGGAYAFSGNGKADLNLQTALGELSAKATLLNKQQLDVSLDGKAIQLDKLLDRTDLPQSISLLGRSRLDFSEKGKLVKAEGILDVPKLLWNETDFSSIRLSASYLARTLNFSVQSKAAVAQLIAEGKMTFANKRIASLSALADVVHFQPSALGIKQPYGAASFAGSAEANLTFPQTKVIPCGTLSISNFQMKDTPRGDYVCKRLKVQSDLLPAGENYLTLRSDFLDADFQGQLSPALIKQAGKSWLQRALPGLLASQSLRTEAGVWEVNARLKDTEVLQKLLGVNLSLPAGAFCLKGKFDSSPTGRTSLQAWTDSLVYGSQKFGKSSLSLTGAGTQYACLIQTHRKFANKDFALAARLTAQDSTLHTQIDWHTPHAKNYDGQFRSSTRFHSDAQGVNFSMFIEPTQFFLADSLWHISSGNLAYNHRTLAFHQVSISHADQSLHVNGEFSPNSSQDSIVANLRDIDVDYILNLANFHAVEFGGRATGQAVVRLAHRQPQVFADLHIPDFTFNGGAMGKTHLLGSWSKADNRIRLDAAMLQSASGKENTTNVKGYVDLTEKGIKLDISAQQTDLKFLRRYMNGIFEDFEGKATGHVELYGPFKKLDFGGEVEAEAKARIPATGVTYRVSGGKVLFRSGEFAFQNFTVNDERGGAGQATGSLRHTHLKNLRYDFQLAASHLLCYDRPAQPGLPFASTTVGTGNVSLSGSPGIFTADINLRPEAPSTLTYTMGTTDAASEQADGMVRFHEAKDEEMVNYVVPVKAKESGQYAESEYGGLQTDIFLNFLIDMNPTVQVKIITDPRAGDAITAWGEGPIRASWHNKGNFEMYGTFNVARGKYQMSIQDVIRKELTLRSTSKITFAGDAKEADLDLHAAYTLNGVSLSDLGFSAGFSGKTARVDCLLNIGGKAKNPQVTFDLDLSGITEDEKQMVRQLISTDEDMNRQAIYLLGIGRFYTSSAGGTESAFTSQQQSNAAMRSLLSTTLTGQLNAAIASALGAQSHWSFGTNVTTGTMGWNEVEVDGLLQGRLLNDRLLINGNFGYRDHPTYTSNFVGDFDVRYLLTPRGTVSLRAYSETTDRYFTKSSLTTQGIGITLQRDFSRFNNLFRWGKKKEGKKGKDTAK